MAVHCRYSGRRRTRRALSLFPVAARNGGTVSRNDVGLGAGYVRSAGSTAGGDRLVGVRTERLSIDVAGRFLRTRDCVWFVVDPGARDARQQSQTGRVARTDSRR